MHYWNPKTTHYPLNILEFSPQKILVTNSWINPNLPPNLPPKPLLYRPWKFPISPSCLPNLPLISPPISPSYSRNSPKFPPNSSSSPPLIIPPNSPWNPPSFPPLKVSEGLSRIPHVMTVHELHIWAITKGKVILACHIRTTPHADTDKVLSFWLSLLPHFLLKVHSLIHGGGFGVLFQVLQEALEYCEKCHGISHSTIQIERSWLGD